MLQLESTANMPAPWTHWFLYGETGSSKTTVASTFPRPLFLVPRGENSMVTLRGTGDFRFQVVDYNTMLPTIRFILQESARLGDDWPFDTLVVESLSHYQEFVINALTGDRKGDMTQQLWGKLQNHFQVMHDNLRSLQMHVVFTALSKIELDANKVAIGGPMISGATSHKLPSACDVIGYCEVIGGKYRVHFHKYGPYAARSRFRRMPRMVENFRYSDIEQYLT